MAVANGYKNVYWMRDGIKGWKNVGYATVGKSDLLNDLIDVNKTDFSALLITEKDARRLKNCCFVDFREKSEKIDFLSGEWIFWDTVIIF